VRNSRKGVRRFTIANLLKKTSFFNQGMLISIFSVNKHKYHHRYLIGSRILAGIREGPE
jgi:hypothetical protein